MFSERSERSGERNAWTRAKERRIAAGGATIDLTASNPTRAGLPCDYEAVAAALAAGARAPYEPHPLGLAEARAVIAERTPGVDASSVMITASTSEAYAFLFTLLCDPGDELLAPEPSYPLLAELAHAAGVVVSPYPLVWDGRWSVDLAGLYEAIGERTRALITVSPNHPTGHYTSREELAALSSFGLPVIVDEVFHEYPLEAPSERARAHEGPPLEGLVFALDGLSKRAALPQLKLAWLSARGPGADEAMARLEAMADTYLSASGPPQRALAALLDAGATTAAAIRERTARNLARLRAAVADTALSVPRVEGGWYAPVRGPAVRTDEAWALSLLSRGVLVHPGYFYDFPADERWLVLSLLTPEGDFDAGLAVLREEISGHR